MKYNQLELANERTTLGLKKYLDITREWMLQFLNTKEKEKKKETNSIGE